MCIILLFIWKDNVIGFCIFIDVIILACFILAPCGGNITPLFDHGLILSPDYPTNYVKNETCIWVMTANKFGYGNFYFI